MDYLVVTAIVIIIIWAATCQYTWPSRSFFSTIDVFDNQQQTIGTYNMTNIDPVILGPI